MKATKAGASKSALIKKIDKRLDEQYLDKGYFQDKVEKANEILRKAPLPLKPKA